MSVPDTESGFARVYRSIREDEWIYGCSDRTKVLVELSFMAAHSTHSKTYRGTQYWLEPGQLITTAPKLLSDTHLDDPKGKGATRNERWLYNTLEGLEKRGYISLVSLGKGRKTGSLITVNQLKKSSKVTEINGRLTEDKNPATAGAVDEQAEINGRQTVDVNNKDISNKEDQDQKSCAQSRTAAKPSQPKRFIKPTRDQVLAYMTERGRPCASEAERFCDYYESNGWKVGRNSMKDWKAAIRNWLKGSSAPASRAPSQPSVFKPSQQVYQGGDL